MSKRAAVLFIAALLVAAAYFYGIPIPAPHQLTINGELWRISDGDMVTTGMMGYTQCESRSMLIASQISDADRAEVLVHESLHALTCLDTTEVHNFLYNNGDSDHAGIHWAAPHVVSLMVENPHLVLYVMKYGRSLSPIEAQNAGGEGGDPPKPVVTH